MTGCDHSPDCSGDCCDEAQITVCYYEQGGDEWRRVHDPLFHEMEAEQSA